MRKHIGFLFKYLCFALLIIAGLMSIIATAGSGTSGTSVSEGGADGAGR